jgi:hypothetical protein
MPETERSEPATAGLRTVREMLNAGWPVLLAAFSFLVTTNLSDSIFDNILGGLQTFARAQGASHCPTHVTRSCSSLSSRKPRFHHASSLRSMHHNRLRLRCPPPSRVRDSRSVAVQVAPCHSHRGPGLSPRNLACLRALAPAALFLAGTLGSSWFAVLEALQNADYVLTTRGTAPPDPTPICIGTVTGTPSKRCGTRIEGQVEQRKQRHQAATHTSCGRRFREQASCHTADV